MAGYILLLFAVASAIRVVVAQSDTSTVPLASKHFAYPSQIPYQVDPVDGVRGPQQGYNLCNSTTENQQSLCQTSFVDSVDDFCLWAPPTPDSTIADTEGVEVAWCSRPGHGTRLIPAGALQGVQFMRTPDYVQVVGFIDQTLINIQAGDSGGELDPHGADGRGNPLGGLVYSNGFPSNGGNNNTYQQATEWHNFMGGNVFCIKACDPAGANASNYCQHIFDRLGCAYNAPNNAQSGVFEACDGDSQDFPGVYTSDGQVLTYTQPPESDGAITAAPYTPRVPASSNCVTYESAALYTGLPGGAAAAASTAVAAGSAGAMGDTLPASTTRPRGSAATQASVRNGAGSTSDAMTVVFSLLVGTVGTLFSILVFS